jgi:hypothetical protein
MFDAIKHYKSLYQSVHREFEFRAKSKEEFVDWQSKFRPRLREILGLTNMEADLPKHQPTAEMRTSTDMGTYIREEWHLWVEPTVPLPFYFLHPKEQSDAPRPLVLTPHGHNHPYIYVGISQSEDERKSIEEGQRDIAVQAVNEGYMVIAATTRGFGDTRTKSDAENNRVSSCRIELMHGLLVGRTPIGERVWDISRLIDWATSRDDVDAKRIAITGNSGGGTISVFAPACDTRISVAVPSCYFCTFEGSIGSIHHCDCNYVPGIMRLGEMYDVAGLIAPRPFKAIAGKDDTIFPIEHVKYAFERLKKIYTVAGVPDNCQLYIGEYGHRYYKDGAWGFIRQHFEKL